MASLHPISAFSVRQYLPLAFSGTVMTRIWKNATITNSWKPCLQSPFLQIRLISRAELDWPNRIKVWRRQYVGRIATAISKDTGSVAMVIPFIMDTGTLTIQMKQVKQMSANRIIAWQGNAARSCFEKIIKPLQRKMYSFYTTHLKLRFLNKHIFLLILYNKIKKRFSNYALLT